MTIGTWGVVGGGQAAEGVKMGGGSENKAEGKSEMGGGWGGGGAQEAQGVRKEKG